MRKTIPMYTPPWAYCYHSGIVGASLSDCANQTLTVDVGTTLYPYLYISCYAGDQVSSTLFSVQIVKDGVVVKECSEYHSTGDYLNCNWDLAYSFVMPNQQVKIELKGWAYDPNNAISPWTKCFTITYTLNPATQYCNQDVKVRGHRLDGTYVNLSGEWVYAQHGTEPALTCTTNYAGECTIQNLEVGKSYTLSVDPSGYEPASKSITACTGTRETLTCEETAPTYVNLTVCVRDANTLAYLPNADVYVAGVYKCTTGANGCCNAGQIVRNQQVTIRAYCAGYKDRAVTTSCLQDCTVTIDLTPLVPCDGYCVVNGDCQSGLVCNNFKCRNPNCLAESDCICPQPCYQTGRVVNKDTNQGIAGWRVDVQDPNTYVVFDSVYTDTNGYYTVELTEGQRYLIVPFESPGATYICELDSDCVRDITADCSSTIPTIKLKPVSVTCDQPVRVVDALDQSAGVAGANIYAMQSGVVRCSCVTGTDGRCTLLALTTYEVYNIVIEPPEPYLPPAEQINLQACTGEQTYQVQSGPAWYNFDMVVKAENDWAFNMIGGGMSTVAAIFSSKIVEKGISDYIHFKGYSLNQQKRTISLNFDAVTTSPLPEWLESLLWPMFLATILLGFPMGIILILLLSYLGIFKNEAGQTLVKATVKALLWPGGAPVTGLSLRYYDRGGTLQTAAKTASDGLTTIDIYGSDTFRIDPGEYQSVAGTLLLGKDISDNTTYTIRYNAPNEVWLHYKEQVSGPFNVKVITESGDLVVGAMVVIPLQADDRAQQETDATGLAHFAGLPKKVYGVSVAAIAGAGVTLYGTQILDLMQPEPLPDPIVTIVVSDKAVITKIVNPVGGDELITGVECVLFNEQTGLEVERKTTDNGIVTFLVVPDPVATYKIEESYPGVIKPETVTNIPAENTVIIVEPEYDDCCNVSVTVVRNDNPGEPVPGAIITLTKDSTVIGPQPATQKFLHVPYGTYVVTVECEGYALVDADKTKIVDESCGTTCYWTLRVEDTTGSGLRIKCKVVDADNNPVPGALIQVDYKATVLWADFDLLTYGSIATGSVVLTTDGPAVQCDDEGNCDFYVPSVGTKLPGDITAIDAYRVCAGHQDYYNKAGKKGEWSDWIEVKVSVATPILFTLYKTSPSPGTTMLLIYGIATAGLAIGGTVAKTKSKAVGTAVQLSAIIPAALAGYEAYKIIKAKWPSWLGG